MKRINLIYLMTCLVLAGFIMIQSACTNDKLPEPTGSEACENLTATYDNQIKPIIDASCAIPGCHATGSANGDLTNYASMSALLTDQLFRKEVVVDKTMPPGGSLSDENLQLIECWVEANYPQN